jgi:hypothetical protein
MKSWAVVLFNVICIVGCVRPTETVVDGKTAEDWKASALAWEAKAISARAEAEKEIVRMKSEAEASPTTESRSFQDSPCARFTTDEAGLVRQNKACDNWLLTLKRRADEESMKKFKARLAAHQRNWKEYPELMTQFVITRDKINGYMLGSAEIKELRAKQKDLLDRNPQFAGALREAEHYLPPAYPKAQDLDTFWQARGEASKYLLATTEKPPQKQK